MLLRASQRRERHLWLFLHGRRRARALCVPTLWLLQDEFFFYIGQFCVWKSIEGLSFRKIRFCFFSRCSRLFEVSTILKTKKNLISHSILSIEIPTTLSGIQIISSTNKKIVKIYRPFTKVDTLCWNPLTVAGWLFLNEIFFLILKLKKFVFSFFSLFTSLWNFICLLKSKILL